MGAKVFTLGLIAICLFEQQLHRVGEHVCVHTGASNSDTWGMHT